MIMDKRMRDKFGKAITDWESNHPNDRDIGKFLDEIVKVAINPFPFLLFKKINLLADAFFRIPADHHHQKKHQ